MDEPQNSVDIPVEGVVQTTKVVRLINIKSSDRKVREALRTRAHALFQKGIGVCDIARQLEVNVVTVSRWFKAFKEGNNILLKGERRRGPSVGKKSILDKSQQEELRHILTTQCPIDCSLPYRRWSFAAVAELIKMKFRIQVSRVTAGKWLASCQREE